MPVLRHAPGEQAAKRSKGCSRRSRSFPFKVDLRAARESFTTWLEGLWFAPTELKNVANLGQLAGVYIPYWTYDAMTYTKYRGMRGDDYQETEYYTETDANGNEVQKSRTVTRTNWYTVSGEVQHFFDDVLVCGSKSVPPHLIDGLEPWDTGELEPFQDSFLAGLKTERYAVDLKQGLVVAKQLMQPTIHNLICRDIGGDHQRVETTDTRYLGVTFKHCLLPVWVANYRYHEKLFQILVNGRIGEGVRRAAVELAEDRPARGAGPACDRADRRGGGDAVGEGRVSTRSQGPHRTRHAGAGGAGERPITTFEEATWPGGSGCGRARRWWRATRTTCAPNRRS